MSFESPSDRFKNSDGRQEGTETPESLQRPSTWEEMKRRLRMLSVLGIWGISACGGHIGKDTAFDVPPEEIPQRTVGSFKDSAFAGAGAVEVKKETGTSDRTSEEEVLAFAEESEREEIRSHIEYLKEEFQSNYDEILSFMLVEIKESRSSVEGGAELVIEGAQDFGLDESRLRAIWSEDFYPRGVIASNVDTVRLINEHRGNTAAQIHPHKNHIHIFASAAFPDDTTEADVMDAMDLYFAHEVGHLNDWENHEFLNIKERLEMYRDVIEAYKKVADQEERLEKFSRYVSGITWDGSKDFEKYLKVREFWAELSKLYLAFPFVIEENFPELMPLAEKWLKRKDPSYNPLNASLQRYRIIFGREPFTHMQVRDET